MKDNGLIHLKMDMEFINLRTMIDMRYKTFTFNLG